MDVDAKLKIISNYHDKLLERYHALGTTIAQLTAKGCVDAKEHWKNGKYLYLLYKMKDGVRRKKYVGNHPLRVAEARQKLQNYQDRLACILTQEKVKDDLDQIEDVVRQLLGICSRFDLAARICLAGRRKWGQRFSLDAWIRRDRVPKRADEIDTGRPGKNPLHVTSANQHGSNVPV